MIVGSTYKVSTGTLTIRRIGVDKMITLWYEADRPEYSREVQMGTEHVMKIKNLYEDRKRH